MSLSELRHLINGLSLYMMQERRHRAVQFQVIQKSRSIKAVIINLGSIRQKIALPTNKDKREVPLSSSVQSSSILSVIRPTNATVSSLRTSDDFPIPYTDYSLIFGNLGSRLHPWDLETLLIAVSAAIDAEIVEHGRNARSPSEEYSRNLGGLQLWVQKMPWVTVNLAWAELAIIVHGLRLYIVDDRHDQEAFIDVVNHVTGTQIALAWIGKPHQPFQQRRRMELKERA